MNEFEYVMALMAIILGLGITHLLSGFGKIIYRLTGHGEPVRFDWVHFLWVLSTFLGMVSYWWYSFSRVGREEWALFSYLLMLPLPVFFYLQCVILYPQRLDEVADLRVYFMATRRWFFGLILLSSLADMAEGGLVGAADPAAVAYAEATGWSLTVVVAYSIVVAVCGMISNSVRVQVFLATTTIVLGVWQQFDDHPVLGALRF